MDKGVLAFAPLKTACPAPFPQEAETRRNQPD
jgi:hypothetical protein